MKNIFFTITGITSLFIITSCCKAIIEDIGVLKNESSHFIEIKRFRNGSAEPTITIAPAQKIETYLLRSGTEDSIIVSFGKTIEAVHYSPTLKSNGNNLKALKADNLRSLYNVKAYNINREELACNGSSTTSTFTFVEQDYIDASK